MALVRREKRRKNSVNTFWVSDRFQIVVTSALSADYVGYDWFDEFPSLRFTTKIVNRNEALKEMLERHGHSYRFDHAQSATSNYAEEPENVDEHENANDDDDDNRGKITVRLQEDPDGFEELPFSEDTEEMIVN